MKMLKHILAFLALILVSLAPVYADEGYIPYFPDFLEPDGIGFRGPAEINTSVCLTSHVYKKSDASDYPLNIFSHECNPQKMSSTISTNYQPAGVPWSDASDTAYASPITLEYRKNYLFDNLTGGEFIS